MSRRSGSRDSLSDKAESTPRLRKKKVASDRKIISYVRNEMGVYSTTQLPFNQWLKTIEFVAIKCLSTKTERGREKKISQIRISFMHVY